MKGIVWSIFIIILGLITFFGLGPVLFADGTDKERIITFVIVVLLYLIIIAVMRYLLKLFR